jgi:hypothetical protein
MYKCILTIIHYVKEYAMTSTSPLVGNISASHEQAQPPKLLDQLLDAAQRYGHTIDAANGMQEWSRRYIVFHGRRHPRELGRADVSRFLEHVAATEKDPVRALDAARAGLDFLYREVLQLQLGELPLPRPPKLLDQLRQVMRVRHNSVRTEECYVQWATRYILFHGKRHPRDMGAAGVTSPLDTLPQVSAEEIRAAVEATERCGGGEVGNAAGSRCR